MNKPMTIASSVGLALAVSPALAAPQAVLPQQTGIIIGHVRDTAGKPLAGIHLEIMQTGEITATDKEGAYIFTGEDLGAYTLTAQGNWSPIITTRTEVKVYSRVVMTYTLKPDGITVMDFSLMPLGTRWVSPQPFPILKSGPGTARQSSEDDAFGDSVFSSDAGLRSTARSR